MHLSEFQECFKVRTRNQSSKAKDFIKGLFGLHRKNLQDISSNAIDPEYYRFQHFISDSPWDHRKLMDQVACNANQTLVDRGEPIALNVDEVSFAKKSDHSVGVANQYLGRYGKVDNGQVAVCGQFAQNGHGCLVDTRLFLPRAWTEDTERLDAAGVPDNQRTYKTKIDIALEMIDHQKALALHIAHFNKPISCPFFIPP